MITQKPAMGSFRVYAGLLLAVLMALLVVDGIYRFKMLETSLWSGRGFDALTLLLPSVVAVFTLLAMYLRRRWGALLALSVLVYLVAVTGLAAPLAMVVIAAASFLIGDWLLQRLQLSLSAGLGATTVLAFSTTIGLGVLMAVIQVSAHWPVNYPIVYIVILVLVIWGRFSVLQDAVRATWAAPEPDVAGGAGARWAAALAAGLLAFTIIINVIFAAKPETGPDGLSLHLWIAAFVESQHYWHFDPTRSAFSLLPMGSDWVFTLGYMLGGEYAARLINLAGWGLLAAMLYGLLRQHLGVGFSRLLLAAFVSTPLVGIETGTLLIDGFWSLITLAAVVALIHARGEFFRRWVLVVLLLSMAMATKVLSGLIVLVFVARFFWELRSAGLERRQVLRMLAVFALLMLVIGAVPYLYAWWRVGNPVFPFMNGLFESVWYPATNWGDIRWSASGNKDFSVWTLLYDITVKSSQYIEGRPGAAGFLWLVFLPPALLLVGRRSQPPVLFALGLAAVFVVGVIVQIAYLRYLLPVLPLLLLVIANYLAEGQRHRLVDALNYLLLLGVVLLNVLFFNAAWMHSNLIDLDQREYRLSMSPHRDFIDYLNHFGESGMGVMFVGFHLPAQLNARAWGDAWIFPFVSERLSGGSAADEFRKHIAAKNILYVMSTDAEMTSKPAIAAVVEQDFERLLSVGGSFLAVLRDRSSLYDQELLLNADFTNGLAEWSMHGSVSHADRAVQVSQGNTLLQRVAVEPGESYLIHYSVQCAADSNMLLQVNWNDHSNATMDAVYDLRACGEGAQQFERTVVPPPGTASAVFYVGTIDSRPVTVNSVSMKH